MYAFGKDRTALIRDADATPDAQAVMRFDEFITRRAGGEPVAYITGSREFWSLEFAVNPSVLIPRPDSELLVEMSLRAVNEMRLNAPRIADLGTGSGAIAIAIAHERPDSQVVATDRSQAAIDLAVRNAANLNVRNIQFRLGNWTHALATDQFDLIVSNPPYLAANDPHLKVGDVSSEPVAALVSGASGMEDLKIIIQAARTVLLPLGRLLVEHGFDQATSVRNVFSENGYRDVSTHRDLAGHERLTEGTVSVSNATSSILGD